MSRSGGSVTRVPAARRSGSGARWVPVGALALVVVALVVVVVVITSGPPPTGYDISYPQCSKDYPPNPLFAIVGVNGGLAGNANRCLGSELRWARATRGQKRPTQPPLSLYIDTGNPGAHHVPDWPTGGTAPAYGACNGLLTNACSYLYGEHLASHDYHLVAVIDPASAKTVPWWLDVELTESWAGTYQLNIATLQGFIAGVHNAGATGSIGIYSSSAQWKDITGLTAQTTPSVFKTQLLDWIAGTGITLTQARQNCTTGGFTGLPPTLAQYQTGSFDADLRCPAAS